MNVFRFSIAFQKLDGANQYKSNALHSRRQELNTKILMLWYKNSHAVVHFMVSQ